MLREVYRFELKHHLRSPLFWLSGVLFFMLTFGAVSSDAVQIGGSIGNVNRNAPFVVMRLLLTMSILGVFVTTAFVAGAVLRDAEHGTDALLFSTRLSKRDYLLGRFAGAFTAALAIFVPVMLAIFVGTHMPWIEPERVGPDTVGPYAFGFLVLVLPNVLLMSALLFGLATLTRSMMGTYVGLVAFFVGYAIAGTLLTDVHNTRLASMIDPFGLAAFSVATRYWTTFDRNTRVLELGGTILQNRALWLGVAVLILGATYVRFRMGVTEAGRRRWRRRRAAVAVAASEDVSAVSGAAAGSASVDVGVASHTGVKTRHDAAGALVALAHQTRVEVVGVLKSLPFLVILAFGVLNLVGSSFGLEQIFGTPVYPVTNLMLELITGAFLLFAVIILTVYSGELVWRERQRDLADVWDALPVPGWVFWGAKLVALLAIIGAVLVVAMLTGIGMQAFRGYTRFQLPLYLVGLFVHAGPQFLMLAVLALFAQVVTNNKYAGFLVMLLYFIAQPVLSALDLRQHLYDYATVPSAPYSDMNGWGGLLRGVFWFDAYWAAAAFLLIVLCHLLWVRGRETAWRHRLRLARERLTRRNVAALALAVVAFVSLGGWDYYNANVLNRYVSPDTERQQEATYEKRYKRYESVPQPRITKVYADVAIYPERRAVDIRGTYTIRNETTAAIDTLHMRVDPHLDVRALEVPGAKLVRTDSAIGWRDYAFATPLRPGEKRVLRYDVGRAIRGFANEPEALFLAHDGSFLNNFDYFPHIGYDRRGELQDPNERRKRGLPPVQRMPKLEDESARNRTYLTAESDWVDFETVVSTSADQIALAPGYLVKEWTQNGRRFFHYKMDAPILGFWAYLSADWQVARDRWHDVDIAVYHDPAHAYNVPRMIDAVKKSLDLYTREFGPYQYRQVRIVEFPRYARFAQSFPNTIPFSEGIGFIARLDDPDDVDYVFYVTAHEVAHQWWAHQVIGGWMQGATMLSETLAQYSALLVMEHEYGREHMRRFLKYELDSYLRGRGGERIEELPLLRVEDQPYIHYRKGSLVMYELREQIGEKALNGALRKFVADWKFRGPPYPTSRQLIDDYVAPVVPAERRGILDDLFRTITLYELKATQATWTRRADGKFVVHLTVETHKVRADGQGNEREVPLDDRVDIAVFGHKAEGTSALGKVLLLEQRHLTRASESFDLVVDQEPVQAGIDPFDKLIDRDPDNNVTAALRSGGPPR